MKILTSALCLLTFAVVLPAFADESDNTLKFYLSKSDSVVSGTIVSEPNGIIDEAGVVEYMCDFRVSEVLKGESVASGATTRVDIAKFELGASDHNPLITKGGDCILFLKAVSPNVPMLRTADFWFGIQHSSPSLIRSLRRLTHSP